ncbi:toprim domain-containing protein [Flavobacterium sp. CSZ]|uniref:toprim domain-containing protein n=1 Tax=Flavobacterium sp. CSZ TaxID=2783791 RepID=UPI00188C5BF3|nr:toprim domain-containing protein [Flavobacterium sp. CSZ]MBF4488212.1 toprim domain-containing protein [Flavobacterium sp. CSZ]
MDFSEKGLSLEEVKAMDMVSYLSALGFEPSKISHDEYWYLSPLRNERTASFKINRSINRWYDHGMGKGGSLIDFGMLFFNCSFGDFLNRHCRNIPLRHCFVPLQNISEKNQSKIIILKEQPLQSISLLHYLRQRKIPIGIAREYCCEVSYGINEHSYYGIGFKNDFGGFEIRNPYFKASSSPKGITTFQHTDKKVLVFEGFMDFLSYRSLSGRLKNQKESFVVLNSLSFLEKARPFMEKHKAVSLYLDRDEPGQKFTELALGWGSKYKDQSALYKDCKDLNEWMIKSEKSQKKQSSGLKR